MAQDDAVRKWMEGVGVKSIPLSMQEVQEWLDSGLTGEELRGKLSAKLTETEKLEQLYGDDQ